MSFRYVYGPVPSRRLGRALGVSPIPFKTCNYSCVYCQLGRTRRYGHVRREFFPPQEVLAEVRQALALHARDVDYVTYVGEGEPTLAASLGWLIEQTRGLSSLPVAVITNGSLVGIEEVRRERPAAQVVMPSLDAADPATFRRIDRPSRGLEVAEVIEGLVEFRRGYRGRLWLEVMLVHGVNDGEEVLTLLRQAIDRIRPDRVYVNVPIRPPAETWVRSPEPERLVRAHALLGEVVFIDRPESGAFGTSGFGSPLEAV